MKARILFVAGFIILSGVVFYYSEWLVFYVVLGQCTWPQLRSRNTDAQADQSNQKPVYAMLFADTHLLSRNVSTWFDQIRTDWEMHMAFQTALTLHKPEVVFALGDLMDEGLFLTNRQFEHYVQHFFKLFSTPKDVKMYIIAGNHDIGFHYEVTENLNGRFLRGFKATDVMLLRVRDINFVLINSVLLEGNATCGICNYAQKELQNIAKQLKCEEFGTDCDVHKNKLDNFSKPILIQHYPMYRHSDKDCHEPDEAPPQRKYLVFNESIECHSINVSNWLLKEINPRLVFSGHTHDGCRTSLSNGNAVEFTLASLNWKHKHEPSYGLVVLTPDDYAFTRCLLPTEQSATYRYIFYCILLMFALTCILCSRRKRRNFLFLNV